MQAAKNVSLLPYNTFGMDMPAENFIELPDESMLPELTETFKHEKHVLGGGSNVLLTEPVKGLVILNNLKGIIKEKEDEQHVWLRVSAGEVWHELVMYAIDNGLAGIENLALIPGKVGASPMQNIGAYGVEAKETIESVRTWHWNDAVYTDYSNADCRFGYRDSIFKHELKGKVLITSVLYKLNKHPTFNVKYGAIEQELEKTGVQDLSIRAIAEAVIAIRSSKLPDPKEIGNAGSFFKNPAIPLTQYEALQEQYPDIPSYPVGDDMVKVPAGWMIEQCGWKGYTKGNYGVHKKQALVLVNYGQANGKDIWQLSADILQSVKDKYGIELEREVQIW